MTTYIEEIQKDLEEEKDIHAEDFELIFKRKYAYLRFFFDNSCESSKSYKLNKEKIKKALIGMSGSAHFIMRNHNFLEANK